MMNASHLARSAAVVSLVAACTGSASLDDAAGTAADAAPLPRAPETGRYWAHVFGHGAAGGPVALWFEYKPDSVPTWVFVPRTPEQAIAAGRDLATVDAWLDGLDAGICYSVRQCTRDAAGNVACDPVAMPFSTRAPTPLMWV